jgi:hypothetical protein
MSPLLIKISKDFATLWTTIDPIGNLALLAGLTASRTFAFTVPTWRLWSSLTHKRSDSVRWFPKISRSSEIRP